MKISLLFLAISLASFSSNTYARFSFFKNKWWQVPREQDALHIIGNSTFESIHKNRLTFLVWNAHKESMTDNWQKDFAKLSAPSDFILLQESTSNADGTEFPLVFTPYEAVVGESFYFSDYRTGNVTLSHYHAVYAYVYHSPVKEPIIGTRKPVIVTQYSFEDGRNLLIANIHAINFVGYRKFKRHINQIAAVIKKFDGPVVWAGDFNTWSKRRTRYLRKIMHYLGLHEAEFTNAHRVKTYNGYPLDHFYFRGAKLIYADFPKVHSSDHNPMVVTLQF